MKKFIVTSILAASTACLLASSASALPATNRTPISPNFTSDIQGIVAPEAIFYDYEPNNRSTEANYFEIGGQISGSLQSSTNDFTDYFKFTPTTTGTYRFALTQAQGSPQQIDMYLKDSKLTKLATISYNASLKYIDYTVVAGQSYYIQLYSNSWNLDNTDCSYNVYTTKL